MICSPDSNTCSDPACELPVANVAPCLFCSQPVTYAQTHRGEAVRSVGGLMLAHRKCVPEGQFR